MEIFWLPDTIYTGIRDSWRAEGAYGLGRVIGPGLVFYICTKGLGKITFAGTAGTTAATKFSLNTFITTPRQLINASPAHWYAFFKKQGFNPRPLGKGYHVGIPFEQGGGFRVNWGSGNYLQFHPGSIHHANIPYWKVSWSSGGPPGQASGTIRFDIFGNPVP